MKVIVFTSTRADSGILEPIVEELQLIESCEVHALVSGTHLDRRFGYTAKQVMAHWKSEFFHELPIKGLGGQDLDLSLGLAEFQSSAARLMDQIEPSIAVVLGDRVEALHFALVCAGMGVPIAHLHGGELSFGSRDELYRHAITKLSSLHFPSSKASAKRLAEMGENPDTICFFGPISADRIKNYRKFTREELSLEFGVKFGKQTAIVSMHGAKFDSPSTSAHLKELFKAFDGLDDFFFVFTGPNADPESQGLAQMIKAYCTRNPERAYFVENFGSDAFLSVMSECDIAIGNSSSFVHEAPELGTPALLLGSRQAGRYDENGTIRSVGANSHQIQVAISEALASTLPSKGNYSQEGSAETFVARLIALQISSTRLSQEKVFWNG